MNNLALATELKVRFKKKITELQKKRDYKDSIGQGGACIAITGEINAYNAAISEIERLTKN